MCDEVVEIFGDMLAVDVELADVVVELEVL
jgi:hypothetical protein